MMIYSSGTSGQLIRTGDMAAVTMTNSTKNKIRASLYTLMMFSLGALFGFILNDWHVSHTHKQTDSKHVLAQVGNSQITLAEFTAAYDYHQGKLVKNFDSRALLKEMTLQKHTYMQPKVPALVMITLTAWL